MSYNHQQLAQKYAISRSPYLSVMAQHRQSRVNGPGKRHVIWTQGCGKACRGCFNPESWPTLSGSGDTRTWNPASLAAEILRFQPEGLTISGGDPLEQPLALLRFLESLHSYLGPAELAPSVLPKGIILFTGFTIGECQAIRGPMGAAIRECLTYIDCVIDGRFIESEKHESGLSGSSNQQFHFNRFAGRGRARITESEIEIDQAAEIFPVHGASRNVVGVTGFPDFNADRSELRKLGLTVIHNQHSQDSPYSHQSQQDKPPAPSKPRKKSKGAKNGPSLA